MLEVEPDALLLVVCFELSSSVLKVWLVVVELAVVAVVGA